MVDFSSVALRILSPDGKTVLAELDQIDRKGQQTARNLHTSHTGAWGSIGREGSFAARKLAGELAMIAKEGNVSARSMKSIAIEAGSLAALFGPQSALVGAVALTGVAIFNMFKRTRDEMEETRKKFEDELARMVNAGDNAALMKQAQDLFRGTPAKNFQDGISALEKRRAPVQAMFDNAQAAGNVIMMRRLQAALDEIDDELTPLFLKFEQLKAAILDLNNTPLEIRGLLAAKTTALSPAAQAQQYKETAEALQKAMKGTSLANFEPDILGKHVAGGMHPDMTEFTDDVLKGIQESLKHAPPLPKGEIIPELARVLELDKVADKLGDGFGRTLANAIGAGVLAGVQGGGLIGGFKAVTGAVLQGLGAMAIEIGAVQLAFSIKQKLWKDSLKFFAPEAGIAVALSMIAFGAALSAAGASMAGSGRGGGYGGGGYSGYGSAATSAPSSYFGTLNPVDAAPNTMGLTPMQPVNINNPVFIGARDPSLQRDFLNIVKFATQRGNV